MDNRIKPGRLVLLVDGRRAEVVDAPIGRDRVRLGRTLWETGPDPEVCSFAVDHNEIIFVWEAEGAYPTYIGPPIKSLGAVQAS